MSFMTISPVVGLSKQLIIFRKVVLPEPEGPMIEVQSPSFIETLTLSKAVVIPS
jgi:hypothetical protein